MMKTYESICLGIPDILIPKKGLDLTRWAVIACDQFTSEPDYWKKVGDFVGDAPSTLNMIYPEVYLGESNPEARIALIRDSMNRYMKQGLFEEAGGFIYVERKTDTHIRKGLLACLDLEHYDFRKGAVSLIRASEGTILERIPPRVKIREGAPIELPHIMVLIDDPENSVIGPLTSSTNRLNKLYDFELMMNSGRVTGYRVEDKGLENGIINTLKSLADPGIFSIKYGLPPGTSILLFAMGDGNHSLATAKTIWEKAKQSAPDKIGIMRSPLRYALVELVNLHDEALVFEPIHRILFEVADGRNAVEEITSYYPGKCRFSPVSALQEMNTAVDSQTNGPHKIGIISGRGAGIMEITNSGSNLPVGTLQNFLDVFMKNRGAREIDYVHGWETVKQIGSKPGNMGFYLPAMNKKDLFKTVILDGALPRKTFSMGEAWEKRFYLEARKLG
jgi:uncharacterized protein (DUF1015 family)